MATFLLRNSLGDIIGKSVAWKYILFGILEGTRNSKAIDSKNLNNSQRNQVKSCQDCQERAEAKANWNQNLERSPYLL